MIMDRAELQRLHGRAVGNGRRYYADGRVNDLVTAVGEYLAQDDPTVEIAYLKAALADVEAERNQLPGALTWKWDGGRCAVLDADRRIVGYLQLGTWKCPSCGASGA